ncbi:alpha/beta hydrolase [Kitasatospora sp. NPDC101155]|uniref:alpha/beta hydrolase n=1 Tax=Kitasatospora sp. NPDC101155 TaxID=3364097 RepID=UPI0037FBD6A6
MAEQYALAHPAHVARLVLDSVAPRQGFDPLDLAALPASARVLRAACQATSCTTDPAADLAATVRRYGNGAQILSALTGYEFIDPNYGGVPENLHEAAAGQPAKLQGFFELVHREVDAASAEELSQGLHSAALYADSRFPWVTTDTPVAGRAAALERTRQRLTAEQTWPYDPATATGLGSLLVCLDWPREKVPPAPSDHRKLPNVPVLLLGGDRDLATPYEWLYRVAESAHDPQIVIVPGAAHSMQNRAANPAGRQAVYDPRHLAPHLITSPGRGPELVTALNLLRPIDGPAVRPAQDSGVRRVALLRRSGPPGPSGARKGYLQQPAAVDHPQAEAVVLFVVDQHLYRLRTRPRQGLQVLQQSRPPAHVLEFRTPAETPVTARAHLGEAAHPGTSRVGPRQRLHHLVRVLGQMTSAILLMSRSIAVDQRPDATGFSCWASR